MRHARTFALLILATGAALAVACGSDDDDDGAGGGGTGGGSPDNVGSVCKVAGDCFTELDGAALLGEALCLDRTDEGYCTHLCESDADCCAVEGECKTGLKQVCAPFESTGKKMCFLSCESADLGDTTDQKVPLRLRHQEAGRFSHPEFFSFDSKFFLIEYACRPGGGNLLLGTLNFNISGANIDFYQL